MSAVDVACIGYAFTCLGFCLGFVVCAVFCGNGAGDAERRAE